MRPFFVVTVCGILGCAPVYRAPRAEPDRVTADELYDKGVRLRGEGRRREAVEVWESGLRIDPNHAETQIALAGALITLHEYGRARRLLDAAQEARPRDPMLWLEDGRYRMDQHEYEDAVISFGRALTLDDSLHSARIGRLEANARLGRCDEVRVDFEALRRIRPVGFAFRAERSMRYCRSHPAE